MARSTNPFRDFDSSPEVIRLVAMIYVKYPLSLRNLEDLLAEGGIDRCHETVRFWWNRFGPMFATGTCRKRVRQRRAFTQGRWHINESSTAKSTTSGEPWITRPRCWKPLPARPGTTGGSASPAPPGAQWRKVGVELTSPPGLSLIAAGSLQAGK